MVKVLNASYILSSFLFKLYFSLFSLLSPFLSFYLSSWSVAKCVTVRVAKSCPRHHYHCKIHASPSYWRSSAKGKGGFCANLKHKGLKGRQGGVWIKCFLKWEGAGSDGIGLITRCIARHRIDDRVEGRCRRPGGNTSI